MLRLFDYIADGKCVEAEVMWAGTEAVCCRSGLQDCQGESVQSWRRRSGLCSQHSRG